LQEFDSIRGLTGVCGESQLGEKMKSRKVLLALIVAVLLMTISGSSFSEVRSSWTTSREMVGGPYRMTIQSLGVTKSSGYQLLDESKVINPESGCCCSLCLPIITK